MKPETIFKSLFVYMPIGIFLIIGIILLIKYCETETLLGIAAVFSLLGHLICLMSCSNILANNIVHRRFNNKIWLIGFCTGYILMLTYCSWYIEYIMSEPFNFIALAFLNVIAFVLPMCMELSLNSSEINKNWQQLHKEKLSNKSKAEQYQNNIDEAINDIAKATDVYNENIRKLNKEIIK